MGKLIASVSKKVPVPGVAYSNHQFHGGLEVEVPEGMSDDDIRERLRQLYALLNETVESEIAAAVEAGGTVAVDGGSAYPRNGQSDRVMAMPTSRYGNGRNHEEAEVDDRGGRASDERYPEERDGRRNDGWRDGDNRRGNDGRYADNGRRREWGRGSASSRGYGGNEPSGGGGGGGRGGPATQAQIKAVFGIAKGQGLERRELMRKIEERFGVRRVEDLGIREASAFIQQLKAS